jgi:thiol-disulfide isomerase/thioredoxin
VRLFGNRAGKLAPRAQSIAPTPSPGDGPATEAERSAIVICGKPGCHLCDEAKPLVARLAAEYGLPVQTVNITDDDRLYAAYRFRIPVIRHAGVILDEGRVTEAALRSALRQLRGRR